MNPSKQILTKISNLLNHIDALIENNLDIRRELLRIQCELSNPSILEDINGIKVFRGIDYQDDERIVIGEEIDKSEVFNEEEEEEEEEEVEGSSFYIQDCGGNIIPVTEIPKSFDNLINATFSVSCKQ